MGRGGTRPYPAVGRETNRTRWNASLPVLASPRVVGTIFTSSLINPLRSWRGTEISGTRWNASLPETGRDRFHPVRDQNGKDGFHPVPN